MSVVANRNSNLLTRLGVTAETQEMQDVMSGFDCDLIPGGWGLDFDDQQLTGGGDAELEYKPLYLEIALGTSTGGADTPPPPESWIDEHVAQLAPRLSKRVFPAYGCAETMRKVTENATGRENVRRVIQCTGEPLLSQYAHPPPAEYAKKVEQTTKALFERLRDQTKVIKSLATSVGSAVTRTDLPFGEEEEDAIEPNLQNKLAEITSLLFGHLLWEMRQLAQVANGMHMATVRVPRKISGKKETLLGDGANLILMFFGTHIFFFTCKEISPVFSAGDAKLDESEMRFVAYACAVFARASGFYIYNYEERRLVQSRPIETIIIEISWVY